MGYQVFISYSQSDRNLAHGICAALEKRDIKCWIAPRDVPAGSDWTDSIFAGIIACSVMVVVFSQHTLDSRHVKSEVRSAFDHEKTIIPVRADNTVPTGGFDHLLGTSHWIDVSGSSLTERAESTADKVASIISDSPDCTGSSAFPTLPSPKSHKRWLFITFAVFLFFLLIVGFVLLFDHQNSKVIIDDRWNLKVFDFRNFGAKAKDGATGEVFSGLLLSSLLRHQLSFDRMPQVRIFHTRALPLGTRNRDVDTRSELEALYEYAPVIYVNGYVQSFSDSHRFTAHVRVGFMTKNGKSRPLCVNEYAFLPDSMKRAAENASSDIIKVLATFQP